jgi:hypothetical protein
MSYFRAEDCGSFKNVLRTSSEDSEILISLVGQQIAKYEASCIHCSYLFTLVPRSQILLPWRWIRYDPPKRRFTQELHGATTQKRAFFIVSAVKTSNLKVVDSHILMQENMGQCTFEKASGLHWLQTQRESAWRTDWLRSRKIRERSPFIVPIYTYVCRSFFFFHSQTLANVR